MQFISKSDIRSALNWDAAISAMNEAHLGEYPKVQDIFLDDRGFSLFGRGVILSGYGAGMKLASINPQNAAETPPRPVEDALFLVIDESTKMIKAALDGPEITRWKTAADSALASKILSRPDSKVLLVLGAGPIALALAEAHFHVRPNLERILLWNRTPSRLGSAITTLRAKGLPVEIATDLNHAIGQADIISAATGSANPIISGGLVKLGTHIDLVGSFRPDMREADDSLMRKGRIFVDCLNTTVQVSGDLCQPIASKVISPTDIQGDLFKLVKPTVSHRSQNDITVFKNGGGAHLDLIISQHVVEIISNSVTLGTISNGR